MIRRILITSTILATLSAPAFAQNNYTVVREAVPEQQQVIIANSPADIALQERIRRINADNAQVNSQVGISETYSSVEPIAVTTSAQKIQATTIPVVTNKYAGAKVSLYAAPVVNQITYANTNPNTSISVQAAPATVSEYRPVTYTRIHRVVKDDTLYKLAKENCVTVVDIQNQNDFGGTGIRIGQALALPASRCAASKVPVLTKQDKPRIEKQSRSEFGVVRQVMPIQTGIKVRSGNAYAVLPKDSLYSIGRRYCISHTELAAFNSIDTTTPIQPGQILRLPNTACNK